MRGIKGIELLNEQPGSGPEARKGDTVVYNARIFLRRGDEVTPDARSIELYGLTERVRNVAGMRLIDHHAVLGRRQPIAAVEKTLYGMQADGYREVLAGAHLAYGAQGVPGLIPPNAMLRIQLWVRAIARSDQD